MEGCSVSLWFFFITFENKEMIPLYHPVQVSTFCTGIIWVLSSHHILWGRLLAKLSDCRFPCEIVACALIFPAWVQLSSISAFAQNKYSCNSPKNSSSMEHTYFWWRWSTCIYMYPENDVFMAINHFLGMGERLEKKHPEITTSCFGVWEIVYK